MAALTVGVGTLLATASLARRPLASSEVRVFRLVNGLPDEAYPFVWAPMQFGTFGTVPLAAGLALARRRTRLALAIGAGGTSAWLIAKVVKQVVDRGRPAKLLDDVSLRGVEEGDRGYPSGHAAVSAAIAVVVWPYATHRSRVAISALTGFVPCARLYVGAHLPLDVIGGSALGMTVGLVVDRLVQPPRPEKKLRIGCE